MSSLNEERNDGGFFSGITEDYSLYTWYKGEKENPFLGDLNKPLAAALWDYEKEFHFRFLSKADISVSLAEAYQQWKDEFIHEYLPGKSNPCDDRTDWLKVFESGKKHDDGPSW